jgi:hypothetical protein
VIAFVFQGANTALATQIFSNATQHVLMIAARIVTAWFTRQAR